MQNQKPIIKNEYVPIHAVVPIEGLPTIDLINTFTKGREQTEEITYYLNWEKSPDELISFCTAVYETEIPKKFDFLIDLNDDYGGIEIAATITQAFWNGILPLKFIDLGYKTITIIQFENGIPERLNSLKNINNADFRTRFALCSLFNRENVLSELKIQGN